MCVELVKASCVEIARSPAWPPSGESAQRTKSKGVSRLTVLKMSGAVIVLKTVRLWRRYSSDNTEVPFSSLMAATALRNLPITPAKRIGKRVGFWTLLASFLFYYGQHRYQQSRRTGHAFKNEDLSPACHNRGAARKDNDVLTYLATSSRA